MKGMKIIDEAFWKLTKLMPNGCIEWQGSVDRNGYGKVKRRKIHQGNIGVHRYGYYLLHGKFPKNLACHTCDNPICCNPHHIFDGTGSENSKDMTSKGRGALQRLDHKGAGNGNSKLTEEKVKQIRELLPTQNNKQIALLFGVHHSTISTIRLGKNWGGPKGVAYESIKGKKQLDHSAGVKPASVTLEE